MHLPSLSRELDAGVLLITRAGSFSLSVAVSFSFTVSFSPKIFSLGNILHFIWRPNRRHICKRQKLQHLLCLSCCDLTIGCSYLHVNLTCCLVCTLSCIPLLVQLLLILPLLLLQFQSSNSAAKLTIIFFFSAFVRAILGCTKVDL